MKNTRTNHTKGFTIIEMMVAITITLILIGIIDVLFRDTSRAVGMGVSMNEIMSNAQIMSTQLRSDAAAMVGPTGTPASGFLVIRNEIRNSKVAIPSGGEVMRDVRVDQLAFIRRSAHNTDEFLHPLTPGSAASFHSDGKALYAKVWYGHVEHLKADGVTSGGGLGNAGLDVLANQWVLGRQAILLAGSSPPGVTIYAQSAQNDATVNGTGYPGVNKRMYNALTDVAAVDLVGVHATLPGDALKYIYDSNARLKVASPPTTNTFDSWRLAQMHPYFVGNVSDFIVEFAADADMSGDVDTDSSQIRWYGLATGSPGDTYGTPTFSGWPTTPVVSGTTWVFQHDVTAGNNAWPYLIRIRYRMHDFSGRIAGGIDTTTQKPIGGRWFEHIIKVPR